jgi:putative radical SAM enzyme (TIGR03279 family)
MQKVHPIKAVEQGSIAEELDVRPGDVLLEVNGSPVEDVLEYKFLINDYYIEVLIRKETGEEWLLEIDKEPHEDLGLKFETGLMDRGKSCKNKCIFCFIDQLPEGMRKSLYFKDDDSRLSFLQGNFISLTNLEAPDIERIIKYRISPLNVSVHTTDPGLRVRMLGNPKAGEALGAMRTFLENGLVLNCQIVLCPGLNDGEKLKRTLEDLFKMGRSIRSIGVVPVGITRHRKGLYTLRPFGREDANRAVDTVEKWQKIFQKEYDSRVVYAADELYLKAGLPFPGVGAYQDFPQLENGIGMMTLFKEQFDSLFKKMAWDMRRTGTVSVATGMAAGDFIQDLGKRIEGAVRNLKVHIYPIVNEYFGETIDVAGLVTGGDLIGQLRGKELGEKLFVPENMLKSGEEVFLDDILVTRIRESLGVKVEVCPVDGGEFLRKIVQEDLR